MRRCALVLVLALTSITGCGGGGNRSEEESWLQLLARSDSSSTFVENKNGKAYKGAIVVERNGNKDERSLFFDGAEKAEYQEFIEYDGAGRRLKKTTITPSGQRSFVWDQNYSDDQNGHWKEE